MPRLRRLRWATCVALAALLTSAMPATADTQVFNFDGWRGSWGISDVLSDAAGNLYLFGGIGQYLSGDAIPGQTQNGSFDLFIQKRSPDGAQIWVLQIGTPAWDIGWQGGVALRSDGGLYVSYWKPDGILGQVGMTGVTYLARVSPSGALMWTHAIDAAGGVLLETQMAVDPADRVVVVGRTSSSSGSYQGTGSIFVGTFTDQGVPVWSTRFGPSSEWLQLGWGSAYGDTTPTDLVVSADGTITIAGRTTSFFPSFGDLPGTSPSQSLMDGWVTRLSAAGVTTWQAQWDGEAPSNPQYILHFPGPVIDVDGGGSVTAAWAGASFGITRLSSSGDVLVLHHASGQGLLPDLTYDEVYALSTPEWLLASLTLRQDGTFVVTGIIRGNFIGYTTWSTPGGIAVDGFLAEFDAAGNLKKVTQAQVCDQRIIFRGISRPDANGVVYFFTKFGEGADDNCYATPTIATAGAASYSASLDGGAMIASIPSALVGIRLDLDEQVTSAKITKAKGGTCRLALRAKGLLPNSPYFVNVISDGGSQSVPKTTGSSGELRVVLNISPDVAGKDWNPVEVSVGQAELGVPAASRSVQSYC